MAKPKPEKFQCTQCGSTSFTREGEADLRCAYCDSLYRVPVRENNREKGPAVVIKKGARVIFGKNSSVTIRGGLFIEDGANVSFLGRLDLVEKSNDTLIEQAKRKLGG
jgi:hypothetical protein